MPAARPSISQLTSHTGFWLRFVSNHVSHTFAQRLSDCGVTVAEWVVLREMYDAEACPPSAIAERTGLTRGAISKLVDRLLAKHLITRETRSDDRRFQTIALTPAFAAAQTKGSGGSGSSPSGSSSSGSSKSGSGSSSMPSSGSSGSSSGSSSSPSASPSGDLSSYKTQADCEKHGGMWMSSTKSCSKK